MSWRARIPENVFQGASNVSEPEPVTSAPEWRVVATRHPAISPGSCFGEHLRSPSGGRCL